jgi:hypothetical protein
MKRGGTRRRSFLFCVLLLAQRLDHRLQSIRVVCRKRFRSIYYGNYATVGYGKQVNG